MPNNKFSAILAIHYLLFYLFIKSQFTPPVCLASFTVAAIARANPSEVSWTGLRLVFASFIIPYVFVYSPQLLLQNVEPIAFVLVLGSTFLAVISFSIADRGYLFNYLGVWDRILFLSASMLLIYPGRVVSSIGLIFLIIIIYLKRRKKKISKQILEQE